MQVNQGDFLWTHCIYLNYCCICWTFLSVLVYESCTSTLGTWRICTKRCTDWDLYICPNSASSPALKVALGRLLVATWWFSGRERSSVHNAHLSSRVRRHGTSYRAPSATLHPWTVSSKTALKTFLLASNIWLYFTFSLLHAPYL